MESMHKMLKAMSHMLCIGYGRFPPQNMTDLWLTIFRWTNHDNMLANSGVYGHDDKVHHYHHHQHHQQHVYHHEQHDRGGHLPRNISLSTIFTSPPLLLSKTTTIKTQQQPDHQHQQHDGGGDLLRNVSRSRHQLDSKPGLLQKAIQGEGS